MNFERPSDRAIISRGTAGSERPSSKRTAKAPSPLTLATRPPIMAPAPCVLAGRAAAAPPKQGSSTQNQAMQKKEKKMQKLHSTQKRASKMNKAAHRTQHRNTPRRFSQQCRSHTKKKNASSKTKQTAAKDTIKIHRVTPTEASCGPTERREAQEKGASSKHKRVDGKKHTITHHRALNKNKNKNRSITNRQRRGSLVEPLVRVQKVILFPLPSLLVCLSSIHFSLGRGTSVRPHTQRGSRCTHVFIAPAPPLTALGYTG
ncbi:hypothetical protein MOQ_008797 [Trypanosoma cruzi marinkellei]|uniref:Uncharacterized protein n=1 Tax=Trypanosoma cruzi marinkellei TaxID=85056 RepID=K2NEM2_TRYCR|nr:hypothetical protein MOQ_008797 [Trypanosoma cruzi marinkellei]